MSDIFNEVDEEVRRERLKQLWERYNVAIIAAAVLIVAAVGGWRAWEWSENKKAAASGAAFEAAVALAAEGKSVESLAAFSSLSATGTTGYRTLARLREAQEAGEKDGPAAVRIYDTVGADASAGTAFQDLAAVRAGLILVDTAPFDEMRRRLEPLTAHDRPFRHTARELLALSAWRTGDKTQARRWADMILTDSATPTGIRARIEVIITLLGDTAKG